MTDDVVGVDWIAERLDDRGVRVVEVDVSRASYDGGHIPGAVLWNAYTDLRDERYVPVGNAELGRLLSRSGIAPGRTVVVYGYGAPLGFWLLKAHGHADVRILSGSREQWTDSGRSWSTDVPEPDGDTDARPVEDAAILASRADVEAALGDSSHVVLDVRAQSEYDGERFWPSGATADAGRAGHIPGAINVPIDLFHVADGTLKSAADLLPVLESHGVTKDKTVTTYCTIGNRASEAWFALTYLLGYPNVRVYYPSWVDWGKAPDTPIVP